VCVNTTDISHTTPPKDGIRRRGSFLGISLVDAGMVALLSERESSNFIGLLASLGEGNGHAAANFALQFAANNDMDEAEREAFCQDMNELFRERCQGYHTNIDVGLVLRGVLGLIRKHNVRIDANYATLVVNALCVESMARSVCPTYNVLDAAKPLLRSYRRLCYSKDGTFKPHAPKSKRVRAWMGLMYHLKRYQDNRFFEKEAKRRRLDHRERRSVL
jgi:predicted unusual protein kinase regulating ubiquinone biosynthesis (AarF/ABC1/UbiB family)